MIAVGDIIRIQHEISSLFHEMHPDREHVSQSILNGAKNRDHVRDARKFMKYSTRRIFVGS